MKFNRKLLAALVLSAAAVPAFAAELVVGDAGNFADLNVGGGHAPEAASPIVFGPPADDGIIFLRVPLEQQRDWGHYCAQYNACGRPARFVSEDWVQEHFRN